MKAALALITVLLPILARLGAAQDAQSPLVARLDSSRDEMTGRMSYSVVVPSPDSLEWTYGSATSTLLLYCSTSQRDPKWVVSSNAAPNFTVSISQYSSVDRKTSSLQLKTDSDYVADASAEYRDAGRSHLLVMDDSKGFTKRALKSTSLLLRWTLLTNDVATFHYDLTTFVPLVPLLYAACGKSVPR